MDRLADPGVRFPRLTLTALVVVTAVCAALATNIQVDTDLRSFAPEGGVAGTLEEVGERFDADGAIQVFADTGPGGNALDLDILVAVEGVTDALQDDPVIAEALAAGRTDMPSVVSFAMPFIAATEILDVDLGDLDAATFNLVVQGMFDDEELSSQLGALLSSDLDPDVPRARGGVMQLSLESDLDQDVLSEVTERVRTTVAAADAPGVRWSVLSDTALEEGIEDGLMNDLPLLLGLSLALVIGILVWVYRSFSDVLVGLLGLLASIIWMVGFAALVGPGMLGLTGGFSQIAIAVPVLLVGLGVDYSVHLTSRYREQQSAGDEPTRAARTAVRTVGVALILATIATVAGFLANLVTPLPPIADFGLFAAAGIVAAFIIFGLAVPAVRVLLDSRHAADPTNVADQPTTEPTPSRWSRFATMLAVRRPGTTLVVTGVIMAVAAVGASGLGTEFDEREFLPEDSDLALLLDRVDAQFGGDVGERTAMVIDGDLSDPDLLEAAAAFEDGLADLDDVQTIGGRPQAQSPFELLTRVGEAGARAREQVKNDLEGWTDPDAALDDVPLPQRIDPDMVEEFGADAELDIDDQLRDALTGRLPEGRDPVVALATTADPQQLQDTIRDQLRDELMASRPDGVDDAVLDGLANLPAEELTRDRLVAAGLETAFDADQLDLIGQLDTLVAAGYDPDLALAAYDGATLAALMETLAEIAGDELAAVRDDRGILVEVATLAGSDYTERLVSQVNELGAKVRAAGGEITLASQALMGTEIIQQLADAQLSSIAISIIAAAILLAVATWWTDRRVALGLIGIVPSIVGLVLVLGIMRAIGLSFDALTATVASIAVGIGVPYGIHLTNRFREARAAGRSTEVAIAETLQNTGSAMVWSAFTTGVAFGVLVLSSSTPVQRFGLVSALMISSALAACVLVQPALLVLWARRRERRGDDRPAESLHDQERRPAAVAGGG